MLIPFVVLLHWRMLVPVHCLSIQKIKRKANHFPAPMADNDDGGTVDAMDIDEMPPPPSRAPLLKKKPGIARKTRKAVDGKIYRPNVMTEERPEVHGIQYIMSPERTVLPPRARQNEQTLL